MIPPVLSTSVMIPSFTAKHGLEVIFRIINQPQKHVMLILGLSVVVIVLPTTGLCYVIKKVYERHFPEV